MLSKKTNKKKLFFCGKGDNSNLNIDISKIQLAMMILVSDWLI
jgi:hypothetical protein